MRYVLVLLSFALLTSRAAAGTDPAEWAAQQAQQATQQAI